MPETLQPYTGAECDWYNLPCHTTSALEWVFNFTQWVPMKIFEKLMGSLGDMIAAIPAPGFFQTAALGLSGVPPGVAFFVGFMQLPEGITMILSAYLLRFAIRRLPFIG